MKTLLGALLITTLSFGQFNPTPQQNTVSQPTTLSNTYTHPSELKLDNTLTLVEGANLTINGNLSRLGNNGRIIMMGNNKLIVNGNINSGIKFEMNGNCCIYSSSNINIQSGDVTSNNSGNYISSGGNINGLNNIPQSICASQQITNPCVSPNTINCGNQCSTDQNNTATWKTVNGVLGWYNGQNPTTPTDKTAIIAEDFSGLGFRCCSLTINTGKSLTVNTGITISVTNSVKNYGSLTVNNGGNLIQVNDYSINLGNAIVKRTAKPMTRYDYTYWSSPVANQTLFNLSPLTLSDKYFKWNSANQSWQVIPSGNEVMQKALGYIVRAPQTFTISGTPEVFSATFSGVLNNGVAKVTTSTGLALLGNPYPSSLDARKFILQNSVGTLYFWTHNTPVSSIPNSEGNYSYNSADYACFNLTGGTATGAGETPNGYIGSGQGFFVETATSSEIVFNNSMRTLGSTNTQFFRNGQEGRLWLNLVNSENTRFSQILLGYLAEANDGFDNLYDGKTKSSGSYLYSILDNKELAIQGKAVFQDTDEVKLGYSAATQGGFNISLGSFEGVFDNQDIYLEDKVLNLVHNLKNSSYAFSTSVGNFKERFVLKYLNSSLTVKESKLECNIYASNNIITVNSKETVKSIEVYDLSGKLLYNQTANNTNFKTERIEADCVIVKLDVDGKTFSKKILLK